METIDFGPATRTLAALVGGVKDNQLGDPTPCPDWSLADLLRHIGGLTLEFTASARKVPTPARAGDGLTDGWRQRMQDDLAGLAQAWADPAAYDGDTHAGPVTLSGSDTARVALNEVTVHGWDVSRAIGQDYAADPGAVAECTRFVASFEAPADDGGLFGPPVATSDDARPIDRLVGLAGRNPAWTATAAP
ncbi:MAG: TIGR03086 family metal-binding protein [Lapillicoccus sp.]